MREVRSDFGEQEDEGRAGKRENPEDIVIKLRLFEVLHGRGLSMADALRQIGISQHTFYRWRKQYGGMNRAQLAPLTDLERENTRLRRAVSDLTLAKLILAEAPRGVKGISETVRGTASALNGRSP